ncbi:hypothetical protein [Psychrobacter sp. 16-MNA-CIBAN-0192]|uniref:hypothetical protein n=1 Tax=Psychrobacter sp. 16-MNA-CIBAN-0192 TaxID=3140448 RepID=UPI0033295725
MKIIDYDTLLQSHKRSGHLSADANIIANRLINDMHIQNGSGLARFLEVEICFDNHRALRVWVQRQLDKQPSYMVEDIFYQLERKLYGILPQHYGC